MTVRNYGQACSVAHFLDRLGSRWYLLIIRDLLIGPRRFTQLLDGLPGIGANRLTDRLLELQQLDVVRKTRESKGHAALYELTQSGQELEPLILSMARWGLRYLRHDTRNQLRRPDLLVVAFRAVFDPDQARGLHESYEFRIDGTIFHIDIHDGKMHSGLGPAMHAAFSFAADGKTFDAIVDGRLDPAEAEAMALLNISGDRQAYRRCLQMFSTEQTGRTQNRQ